MEISGGVVCSDVADEAGFVEEEDPTLPHAFCLDQNQGHDKEIRNDCRNLNRWGELWNILNRQRSLRSVEHKFYMSVMYG